MEHRVVVHIDHVEHEGRSRSSERGRVGGRRAVRIAAEAGSADRREGRLVAHQQTYLVARLLLRVENVHQPHGSCTGPRVYQNAKTEVPPPPKKYKYLNGHLIEIETIDST